VVVVCFVLFLFHWLVVFTGFLIVEWVGLLWVVFLWSCGLLLVMWHWVMRFRGVCLYLFLAECFWVVTGIELGRVCCNFFSDLLQVCK